MGVKRSDRMSLSSYSMGMFNTHADANSGDANSGNANGGDANGDADLLEKASVNVGPLSAGVEFV